METILLDDFDKYFFDYKGNVIVNGDVKAEGTVRVEGNLTINGSLSAYNVDVSGDLIVDGWISAETYVRANSVTAGASIRTEWDVTVFRGDVEAGGEICCSYYISAPKGEVKAKSIKTEFIVDKEGERNVGF